MVFSANSICKEIKLFCEGKAQYHSWDGVAGGKYKKNFEIFFDEDRNTLSWLGKSWCLGEKSLNKEEFSITKKIISYECNATNTNPSYTPNEIIGKFILSRLSGQLEWTLLMSSKKNSNETFFESGVASCNVAKNKF